MMQICGIIDVNRADAAIYMCTASGSPLRFTTALEAGQEVISGSLVATDGSEYSVRDGIPDLTYPPTLSVQDEKARSFYDGRAEDYDQNLYLTFKTHHEDEHRVRIAVL